MACVVGNARERQGKGDACTLAQSPLCSKQLFVETRRALEAVGICRGAAACPGAINSTLRSINRINTLGLRHWGAEATQNPREGKQKQRQWE